MRGGEAPREDEEEGLHLLELGERCLALGRRRLPRRIELCLLRLRARGQRRLGRLVIRAARAHLMECQWKAMEGQRKVNGKSTEGQGHGRPWLALLAPC